MCLNPSPSIPYTQILASRLCKLSSKRHHVRVPGLSRWTRSRKGHEDRVEKIEIKNIKLYMKNQRIREENEKLRRKALALYQEKQDLLAQLQSKLYNCSPQTTS